MHATSSSDASLTESVSFPTWPNDILQLSDLRASMSNKFLRDDVSDFIFAALSSVTSFGAFTFDYYRAELLPIRVDVPASKCELFLDILKRVSDSMKQHLDHDLTPIDLICQGRSGRRAAYRASCLLMAPLMLPKNSIEFHSAIGTTTLIKFTYCITSSTCQ